MSHEIEFNKQKGTHSFYSRKEVPWHKLGQVVEEAKTSDEVIKIANLDFVVVKASNYARYQEDGLTHYYENPDSFSTMRIDTKKILGTVGSRYEILQNAKAFEFFDDIVGSKQAIFETAGVLFNGSKVFITAKLPDYIRLSSNDVIDQYLLLSNDHTGSESAVIMFTPVRVVCNNTLSMALQRVQKGYRIRHTKSMEDRMRQVTHMMGLKNKYFEEISLVLNHMKDIKLKESETKHILMQLILNDAEYEAVNKSGNLYKTEEISARKRNQILDLHNWLEGGVGQDLYKGTGLWLYNGVTGYYNNGKSYSNEEARFENLIGGSASTIVNKAKDLILHV